MVGLLLLLFVLGLLPGNQAQTLDNVQTLYDTLLTSYNKNIRPVLDQSQPTVINITFDFVSIRELDEINGKLSIVGILYMTWVDPRMMWNPLVHGGTFMMNIPITEVWKPDLIIGHPIDSDSVMAVGYLHKWINVRYLYTGEAMYAPGDVLSTTCSIDVGYYPFDTQHCEIMFIPWGLMDTEIQFHAPQEQVLRSYFTGNGEWDLVKAITKTMIVNEKFPTFMVDITMKRRPTFVVVNVILPILCMGLLNSLVFCLPSKSGERVSYAMTVLLAIAVFMTLVGDNLPKTSEPMSTICYFLLANLVMSSVIMLLTIFNLGIYHREASRPISERIQLLVKVILRKNRGQNKVVGINDVDEFDLAEAKLPHVAEQKKAHPIEDMSTIEKWAFPAHENPVDDKITWTDVSHAFDRAALVCAIVWQAFSTTSYFVLVVTQKVPGFD